MFCLIFKPEGTRDRRLQEITGSQSDPISERKLLFFSQCFEVKINKCNLVDLFSPVQYH